MRAPTRTPGQTPRTGPTRYTTSKDATALCRQPCLLSRRAGGTLRTLRPRGRTLLRLLLTPCLGQFGFLPQPQCLRQRLRHRPTSRHAPPPGTTSSRHLYDPCEYLYGPTHRHASGISARAATPTTAAREPQPPDHFMTAGPSCPPPGSGPRAGCWPPVRATVPVACEQAPLPVLSADLHAAQPRLPAIEEVRGGRGPLLRIRANRSGGCSGWRPACVWVRRSHTQVARVAEFAADQPGRLSSTHDRLYLIMVLLW